MSHNNKTLAEMERLADEFEAQAAALRASIALVTGEHTNRARKTLPAKLHAASAIRAGVNGSRATVPHRKHDEPGRLVKAKFTAFVLAALAKKPATLDALVSLLQGVGHPIKDARGITGPMASFNHRGLIKRRGDGSYRLTVEGKRRLAELSPAPADG